MKILLLALAVSATCFAQKNDCDLGAVIDGSPPAYPPIAKAAHVLGTVIMIATFKQNGDVTNIQVLSGPAMLQQSALDYVKRWKAVPYSGIRNCPVVVSYLLDKADKSNGQSERLDSQHVNVYGQTVCLCDPPVEIGKKKFWLF